MKKILITIISTVVFVGVIWCSAQKAMEGPVATATLKVVDDEGNPVEGAEAGITFQPFVDYSTQKGLTDKSGLFKASAPSDQEIYYGAKKEGYYEATNMSFTYPRQNNWTSVRPELTVLLKKKINPVPMYVKKTYIQMPVLDQPVGFDFEADDWVIPYGKGTHSDFVFTMNCKWESMKNYSSKITLSFSHLQDGILSFKQDIKQGSNLLSMQQAPETGYESIWTQEISAKPTNQYRIWKFDDNINYVFRVRSKVDAQGKVILANYGKIYGNIGFSPNTEGKMPKIWFTCYYNPNNQSRSLEFDQERNLTGGRANDFRP
jgi:hypothetical protein